MANPPENIGRNWFKYFKFKEDRDSPGDVRNTLPVVATLIAAITFQAGVAPPGGVWQEGTKAGKAIYASEKEAFYVFLVSNTLALSTSIFLIISLTLGFPFRFEILVATGSMMVTYGSAVFAVTSESTKFRCLVYSFGAFCIKIFYSNVEEILDIVSWIA